MTIYDFVNLCTEDSLELTIFDLNACEVVWKGEAADARWCEYADSEVLSFDAPDKPWSLTVNIEAE